MCVPLSVSSLRYHCKEWGPSSGAFPLCTAGSHQWEVEAVTRTRVHAHTHTHTHTRISPLLCTSNNLESHFKGIKRSQEPTKNTEWSQSKCLAAVSVVQSSEAVTYQHQASHHDEHSATFTSWGTKF
ncbi:RIKEN cDNA 2410002F23, isoform CRA_b [Mus musculus]|uniref:Uncharacterized protein n=1 Tax=Mus musculus TaxID=10090 RepID=Q8CBG0_MOUSE|nr:RIKEN cDNA 2410002F23, isoform CRA_b [Mus musculus]BAC29304.1 unnamed protein product [Mus musculus]BAE38060.1 unnamed protein product [Mus musculus]